jgi:hypothetical protein
MKNMVPNFDLHKHDFSNSKMRVVGLWLQQWKDAEISRLPNEVRVGFHRLEASATAAEITTRTSPY